MATRRSVKAESPSRARGHLSWRATNGTSRDRLRHAKQAAVAQTKRRPSSPANARGTPDRAATRRESASAKRRLDFLRLLEQLPEAAVVVSGQGEILFANAHTENLFSYQPDEIIGRSVNAVAPVGFRARPVGAGLDLYGLRKDGSEFPADIRVSHVNTNDGGLIVATIRDITEQKRAEESLRESEARYRSLVEACPDAVTLTEIEGRILLCNERAATLHGFRKPEEAIGQNAFDFIAPEDRQRAMEGMSETLQTGGVRDVEYMLIRKDGTRFAAELSASVIADEDGKPTAFTAFVRDITERKRMADALQKESASLRLLEAVAFAANEASSVDGAMQFALDRVCAHMGWPVGHVYMRDPCGELVPSSMWHIDDPDRFRAFREVTQATHFTCGMGLPGSVLASGNPAWIMDVTSWPHFKRSKEAKEVGIKTGFAFPVLVENEVVAVLEFYSDEEAEPDEPLLEVMAHIGTVLGRVVERKRAEEALASSEARTRLIIDGACDAFVAMGADGVITDWNAEAEKTFGWPRQEAIGRPLAETVIPRRDRKAHRRGLARFLKTGKGPLMNKRIEVTAVHRDGHELPVELAIRSARFGESHSFDAFVRDVTDRKLAQEELARAHTELEARVKERTAELSESNRLLRREISERKKADGAAARHAAELERSNAELEQFAHVASHDLKEPLRMVASYLELLQRRYKGRLDADADDFIHFAVDGALRMRSLMDGLLALSQVGTHGRPFGPTDCDAVVDKAVNDLAVAIAESRAVITRDPLPTVLGDAGQLEQLFQNLVSNAIKFRSEEEPRVHITARRKRTEWLFSVRDNGIGIDSKYSERIFVVFQRLHAREERSGTGIGLAISKKIVERHGGRIWIESRPGEGATFYFTIPRKERALAR